MKTAKFDKNHSKEFIVDLRKSVDEYFKKNNKTRYGNANMVLKSIFMLCLYFVPYGFSCFGYSNKQLDLLVVMGLYGRWYGWHWPFHYA